MNIWNCAFGLLGFALYEALRLYRYYSSPRKKAAIVSRALLGLVMFIAAMAGVLAGLITSADGASKLGIDFDSTTIGAAIKSIYIGLTLPTVLKVLTESGGSDVTLPIGHTVEEVELKKDGLVRTLMHTWKQYFELNPYRVAK